MSRPACLPSPARICCHVHITHLSSIYARKYKIHTRAHTHTRRIRTHTDQYNSDLQKKHKGHRGVGAGEGEGRKTPREGAHAGHGRRGTARAPRGFACPILGTMPCTHPDRRQAGSTYPGWQGPRRSWRGHARPHPRSCHSRQAALIVHTRAVAP